VNTPILISATRSLEPMRLPLTLAALLIATPVMAQTVPPANRTDAPALSGVNVSAPILDGNKRPLPPICDIPEVKAAAAVPATTTSPAVPAVAAKAAEECVPYTVGLVLERALLWPNYPGEDKLPPDKLADMKWARSALATRIAAGGRIELKKAEADVLSKLMGQLYAPLIIGQIMPLLYPNLQPPEIQ
jgi:hypothetical protein